VVVDELSFLAAASPSFSRADINCLKAYAIRSSADTVPSPLVSAASVEVDAADDVLLEDVALLEDVVLLEDAAVAPVASALSMGGAPLGGAPPGGGPPGGGPAAAPAFSINAERSLLVTDPSPSASMALNKSSTDVLVLDVDEELPEAA